MAHVVMGASSCPLEPYVKRAQALYSAQSLHALTVVAATAAERAQQRIAMQDCVRVTVRRVTATGKGSGGTWGLNVPTT